MNYDENAAFVDSGTGAVVYGRKSKFLVLSTIVTITFTTIQTSRHSSAA